MEMGTALRGVSWGCHGSAWSEALARALPPFADVLQEVPAGGSPPFPAQNTISKAHWAPGVEPVSHTAVPSVSGEKLRSQVPRGRAILLGFFFFKIISIKALSSTIPSFGTNFPASSSPGAPAFPHR